jgi:F0F1-type ATP synthase assembly protein I
MRKHYLISAVISVAITATVIGIGYLIDQWQGSTPTYMLIGFIISGPLSVWANYSLIKKKFTSSPETMKGPDQKSKP